MLIWSGFIIGIFVFLALDLGVFHKNDHVIRAGLGKQPFGPEYGSLLR